MVSAQGEAHVQYRNPHLSERAMIALIWFETALAAICVAARTWVRIKKTKRLSVDDYLVYLAFAALVAMTGLYTEIIPYIYALINVVDGIDAPSLHFIADTEAFLRFQFPIILLFWTTLWAVKASFLAFYKVLFDGGTQPWKVRAWWATVIITGLSYFGCWITQFLSCIPLKGYFTLGTCQTPRDIYASNTSLFYSTGVDITCDLLIMALPLTILPKLRIAKNTKLALAGFFSVGALIIACAIVRLVLTRPSRIQVNPEWLCIMSVSESSVAVMVSCFPTFRKWFVSKEKKPRTWSSSGPKSKRSVETDTESIIPMHPGSQLGTPYTEPDWTRQYGAFTLEHSIAKGSQGVISECNGEV